MKEIRIHFVNGRSANYLPVSVMSTLVRSALECGNRFVYALFEGVGDDDLPVAVLERVSFGPEGEWGEVTTYVGRGEAAFPLRAFYERFLWAPPDQQVKLGVMLVDGVTSDEDLDAGLITKRLDQLLTFLGASRKRHVSLHNFIRL